RHCSFRLYPSNDLNSIMGLEPPVSDEEWARCFGEYRSLSSQNSRRKRIADTINEVVTATTDCNENSGSNDTEFRYRLWVPPRMPRVSKIARDITDKFCAKMRAMPACEREKLEKPLLESLGRRPIFPPPNRQRRDEEITDRPQLPEKQRKEGSGCTMSRFSELSRLLSSRPEQSDMAPTDEGDSNLTTSALTSSYSTSIAHNHHQSVSDLFRSDTSMNVSSSDLPNSQSSLLTSTTDLSRWSSTILSSAPSRTTTSEAERANNVSAESDEVLDTTPPPSRRRDSFDGTNCRSKTYITKAKIKNLTKMSEAQPTISPSQKQPRRGRKPTQKKRTVKGRANKTSNRQLSSKRMNASEKVKSWIANNQISREDFANKPYRRGCGRPPKTVGANKSRSQAEQQTPRLRPFIPRRAKSKGS
ncbi:hypothetical protein V3C99_010997, partial [Haemonchus contortus]